MEVCLPRPEAEIARKLIDGARGRDEAARPQVDRALRIREPFLPEDHPRLIDTREVHARVAGGRRVPYALR